jgi:hypothetical protein
VQDVGRRRAVFPTDPDGGGTWVGVNIDGLIAALLNRTDSVRAAAGQQGSGRLAGSRGAIVPHALEAATIDEAIDRIGLVANVPFAPFRLLLVQDRHLCIVRGGHDSQFHIERNPLTAPFVAASSSLGDMLVEPPRRLLFERLLSDHRDGPLEAQTEFHRHRWPSHPEISVLMSRADARTVSCTQVDVLGGSTRFGARRRQNIGPQRIAMHYREIPDEGGTMC